MNEPEDWPDIKMVTGIIKIGDEYLIFSKDDVVKVKGGHIVFDGKRAHTVQEVYTVQEV